MSTHRQEACVTGPAQEGEAAALWHSLLAASYGFSGDLT